VADEVLGYDSTQTVLKVMQSSLMSIDGTHSRLHNTLELPYGMKPISYKTKFLFVTECCIRYFFDPPLDQPIKS
jgi:hypothetical protein